MTIIDLERRQAWLAFASAAVSGFANDTKFKDEEVVEISVDVADAMLEEYLERFEPGYKPEEPEEDEEEDEEEEDEDEEERPRPRKRGRK